MSNKFFKYVFYVEKAIACISMATIIIVSVFNVFGRYLLKNPIVGAEDVTQLAFCWLIFVGASCAYGEGMHYGMDLLYDKMSSRMQTIWKMGINIVIALASVFLAYQSVILIQNVATKSTGTLRIPYYYINMATLVGFIFCVLHGIDLTIMSIRKLKGNDTELELSPEEVTE